MIYLPPPQPVLNKDIRVSGDVEIHPTASIAPGVILQAAPDRRIVIGADVCIGMGVIINASQGSIEIESGAIIGSGVLIIGECKIGNNACIGTAVTIFQANVEAMKVIEPGAILGDSSRKVNIKEPPETNQTGNPPSQQNTQSTKTTQSTQSTQSRVGKDGYYSPSSPSSTKSKTKDINSKVNTPSNPAKETTVSPEIKNNQAKEPVVGQVYINQLLVTLFPHNKDLNPQTKKLE